MSAKRVILALVSIFAGASASCLAGQIENGLYEKVWGHPDASATLTVDGDRVTLEYMDNLGSAVVEYEVVDVRCHADP